MKFIGQNIFDQKTLLKDGYLDYSSLSTSAASNSQVVTVNTSTGQIKKSSNFSPFGYHGYDGYITILPSDFMVNEEDSDGGAFLVYDDSTRGVKSMGDGNDIWAFVNIPNTATATAVTIYGAQPDSVTVYKSFFTKNTADASLGSGNINTAIDITDTASTDKNFLVIAVSMSTSQYVYGGYITIAKV